MDVAAGFWRDRSVLLTGHTGFKGAWMSLWLRALGADVTGYALAPLTDPSLWTLAGAARPGLRDVRGDIRDASRFAEVLEEADPQVIVHMAAQALVRESYQDPLGTYATNVMGTAVLLQACRKLRRLQCVLVVTSDKVYQNDGGDRPFEEGDRLGGHDPYSNSKACAELLTGSFRDSFFRDGPPLATARAGNVIGGGDWSRDRLVPDCVRALEADEPVNLRYPAAVRPWQHVLEPLSGYLVLAQALAQSPHSAPRAVNFGPDAASFCPVSTVVEAFSARFDGKPGWRQAAGTHPPEAHALTLSSDLARRELGWRPRLDLPDALSWTADWYRAHRAGADMPAICEDQIRRYGDLMKSMP
jgi:CDP-glucose 4,6-dehydratase